MNSEDANESYSDYIRAMSAVLRLGRANALTDHSSVLFNVELSSGVIGTGSTNAHWYQLGLVKALQTPFIGSLATYAIHPDPPHPQVTGKIVPNMQEAVDIVCQLVITLFSI